MRPNFIVGAGGEAKILRKPKVVRSPDALGRAERRAINAYYAKMTARIRSASTLEEVVNLMREAKLPPSLRPWETKR